MHADRRRRPSGRAGSRRDRPVPASIPRPPYAPDAPPLVPAVPPDEFADRMRAAGRAGREVLLELADAVKVGMTTDELDRICHEACIARGGYPSPLDYKGFPKSLCTSVNEVICHGIPDDRTLLDGDIVNCDVTIFLHGVHGDCNATFLVGDVDDEGRRLVQVTKEALWKGIDEVRPGARLYEVGRAIQTHAEAAGFGVVRSFVGHGVGEEFHTAPAVLHYYDPSADLVLDARAHLHDRTDDQRGLVAARPHLARRLDRADARRVAVGAVRAQPARDDDRRRGADAVTRRAARVLIGHLAAATQAGFAAMRFASCMTRSISARRNRR